MTGATQFPRTGSACLTPQDILGSWHLISVELTGGAAPASPPPFGENPQGVLHYLADGRMAVMIQRANRHPIEGGRQGGSDADWRRAADSFTAYAGTFTILPGQIVHHVTMNSYPNDVGVDYARLAQLAHGRLVLETPRELPTGQRPMRLVWQREGQRP